MAEERTEQAEWTGNAAQDPRRLTGEAEGLTVWDKYPRGRNHPKFRKTEFTDWSIISPNSMVDQFIMETTVDDTVTPPNPTPPTNISCWGETPPNSPEYVDSVPLEEYSQGEGVEVVKLTEEEEARKMKARVNDAGERQEIIKFAPALGGNQPEAIGTEEVQYMEYNASGETEPVEVPIALSAGLVGYTRNPNATHPSNEEPQPVEPPPGGGTDGGGTEPEPEDPVDLTSISPETAVAGSGTFVLTVTGTGFDDTCVILFKDAPVETVFVSETELRADTVPVSATAETVDVEVQRGDDLSDVLTFDFVAASRDAGTRKSERKPSKKQKSKSSSKSSKSSKSSNLFKKGRR